MSQSVLLVSTALGIEQRGMEIHVSNLFRLLRAEKVEGLVLCMGGPALESHSRKIPSLHRHRSITRFLSRITRRDAYWIQNVSFFFGLLPQLIRHSPKIVYLGEPHLLRFLLRYRKLAGAAYQLVFFTGGQSVPSGMSSSDIIQALTPSHQQLAFQRGYASAQVRLLSHFILTESIASQAEARARLGLPKDATIILSVGALDRCVKRMDYLIDEVANYQAANQNVYLILLGQQEEETPALMSLLEQKLRPQSFRINTVPSTELPDYYSAANVFALASLREGFGLSALEALSFGLPVVVHDYEISRYVLGEHGYFGNLEKEGSLLQLLQTLHLRHWDSDRKNERINYARTRFSWETLRNAYISLLTPTS